MPVPAVHSQTGVGPSRCSINSASLFGSAASYASAYRRPIYVDFWPRPGVLPCGNAGVDYMLSLSLQIHSSIVADFLGRSRRRLMCVLGLLSASLQLCVLRLGLLQDGDIKVGVFPEREEIFVGGERLDAAASGSPTSVVLRLQSIDASP
jgi:hypothetical protein